MATERRSTNTGPVLNHAHKSPVEVGFTNQRYSANSMYNMKEQRNNRNIGEISLSFVAYPRCFIALVSNPLVISVKSGMMLQILKPTATCPLASFN
jgi:hypothetical protein